MIFRARARNKLKVIEPSNKIRIKDIAQLAGVSAGTVDRVIHKRGQVSEENASKIQKIIEELNYKPNLLARSLASKRTYLFATLLPDLHHSKGYWEAPLTGIQKAWKEISDYNVKLKNFFFDQFQVDSFRHKSEMLIESNPDAVLLAPVYKDETIKLASLLDEKKIPYIFVDSNIEGLNNLSYFGQHSYQSGYQAAQLLQLGLPSKSAIAVIKPSGNISNQGLNREKGFKAFFQYQGLTDQYNFLSVNYDPENELIRENQLRLFFEEYSTVAAAVVFNSRVYEIADFLLKYKIKNVRLIGYDMLKENIEFLRKGVVSFLIAQRPEEQGYQGVLALFNYLAFNQEIDKVRYTPIDIITGENLEYYINFNK